MKKALMRSSRINANGFGIRANREIRVTLSSLIRVHLCSSVVKTISR
jgi:hypothetical protein